MDRISRYIIAGTLAITHFALANTESTLYKPTFLATAGFEKHHMHALTDVPISQLVPSNVDMYRVPSVQIPIERDVSSPYLGINIEMAAHENLTFGIHGQLTSSNSTLFTKHTYINQTVSPTIGVYGYYSVQDTSFALGVDINRAKSTTYFSEYGQRFEVNANLLNPKLVLSYILHINEYSRVSLSGFASLPRAITSDDLTSPQIPELTSDYNDDLGITKLETGFKISYSQEISSLTSLI